jgi:hypothetical protein
MYFWTNEGLGEAAICEAAADKLERLETSLKMFKKETEKTYPHAKRLKDLGSLVVSDAENLKDRLSDYIDGGCCEDELKNLEAQVQALPWTFQKASGRKNVVRIERYSDIVGAHRILIGAIKRAQGIAGSHTRCAATSTP